MNEVMQNLFVAHLLKAFADNYPCLKTLHGHSYNISELAAALNVDQGNMSRSVGRMVEFGLVLVNSQIQPRGRPTMIVQTSPLAIKLLTALQEVVE